MALHCSYLIIRGFVRQQHSWLPEETPALITASFFGFFGGGLQGYRPHFEVYTLLQKVQAQQTTHPPSSSDPPLLRLGTLIQFYLKKKKKSSTYNMHVKQSTLLPKNVNIRQSVSYKKIKNKERSFYTLILPYKVPYKSERFCI